MDNSRIDLDDDVVYEDFGKGTRNLIGFENIVRPLPGRFLSEGPFCSKDIIDLTARPSFTKTVLPSKRRAQNSVFSKHDDESIFCAWHDDVSGIQDIDMLSMQVNKIEKSQPLQSENQSQTSPNIENGHSAFIKCSSPHIQKESVSNQRSQCEIPKVANCLGSRKAFQFSPSTLLGDMPSHWTNKSSHGPYLKKQKHNSASNRNQQHNDSQLDAKSESINLSDKRSKQNNVLPLVRLSDAFFPARSQNFSQRNCAEIRPTLQHQNFDFSQNEPETSVADNDKFPITPVKKRQICDNYSQSEESLPKWKPVFDNASLDRRKLIPLPETPTQKCKLDGTLGCLLLQMRKKYEGGLNRLISGEFSLRAKRFDLADPRSHCKIAYDFRLIKCKNFELYRIGDHFHLPSIIMRVQTIKVMQLQDNEESKEMIKSEAILVFRCDMLGTLNIGGNSLLRIYDPVLLNNAGIEKNEPVIICSTLCDVLENIAC